MKDGQFLAFGISASGLGAAVLGLVGLGLQLTGYQEPILGWLLIGVAVAMLVFRMGAMAASRASSPEPATQTLPATQRNRLDAAAKQTGRPPDIAAVVEAIRTDRLALDEGLQQGIAEGLILRTNLDTSLVAHHLRGAKRTTKSSVAEWEHQIEGLLRVHEYPEFARRLSEGAVGSEEGVGGWQTRRRLRTRINHRIRQIENIRAELPW